MIMLSDAADTITTIKNHVFEIGEVVGALVFGVVIGMIGVIRKKGGLSFVWSKNSTKKFADVHSVVHEFLTEMRVTIRASRCIIAQFHNGGVFADGTSIKRFSVTHESCSNGVTSILLDSQDVHLTKYADMMRLLTDSEGKIIPLNTLQHTPFRSALEINNVEYFALSPLYGMDGLTPIGYVCCNWCTGDELEKIKEEGISEENVESLIADMVSRINSYLHYKK